MARGDNLFAGVPTDIVERAVQDYTRQINDAAQRRRDAEQDITIATRLRRQAAAELTARGVASPASTC